MDEGATEERAIEERKRKFAHFIKAKTSWIYYLILIIILWVNVKIRTIPMKVISSTGKPGLWDISRNAWTLGPDLDPFLFLRYAKEIVQNGSLMALDMMRFVPLGYNPARETMVLPYLIAYLHKFLNIFKDVSVEYAAVVLPVFASIFTTIFFFLLVRKIFESKGEKTSNIIALVASALLVVLPSLLTRTIAGIPEKESVGFMFMFLALYLFTVAWKSRTIKKALIIGICAGLVTAITSLAWGGAMFAYASIGIFGLVVLILDKIGKKEVLTYFVFVIFSLLTPPLFSERMTLIGNATSPIGGFLMLTLLFILVHYALYKTKLRNLKFLQNHTIKKIPKVLVSIIIVIILVFIFGVLLSLVSSEPNLLLNRGELILSKLTTPYSDRLSYTVAENKQPFFSDWKGSMGPLIKGIPIFFWMFFVGTIVLFAEMIKKLRKKEKIILILGYTLFLFALIFSRKSPSSTFNGTSTASFILYFGGYVLLLIALVYVFYKRYKAGELSVFKQIKPEYILVFCLAFAGIIAARSAIRLIMTLTPIATIIVSYFIIEMCGRAIKSENTKKILYWCLAIVLLILLLYPPQLPGNYVGILPSYHGASQSIGHSHIPTSYSHQWQNAMGWVRENTPEDAVFGHWWDYGYWVQSIGDRATMLDGGNAIPYWNYLMGRHGLTAETEEEALELLYSHEVTHFLIDSTDIGKYSAYSSIGSDENYDRFSWINTFLLNQESIQETKDQTIYIYQGGGALDEDLVIDVEGRNVLLPAQAAGIGAIFVYKNNDGTYSQPSVIMIYNNQQYRIPLRYLYIEGELMDFGLEEKNTIEGGTYVFPRADNNQIVQAGAAMYLSPRNVKALWVRLYLFNQGENFKLVHSEPSALNKNLRAQGVILPEIVYFQGIQGPIKIWEINYKGNEQVNPEYIQITFPEAIKSRKYK